MAILTAKVVIKGTRPLLYHTFGPEAIPLEAQEKRGVPGHDPDEWRSTYSATKEGQLYIPGTYVFGCYRNGAKKMKLSPKVASTLQVLEDKILLDRFYPKEGDPPVGDDEADVYIDVRTVRNPSNKAGNIRYRLATKPGWLAEFHILWDNTVVNRDEMRAVGIDAGQLHGIGDGRALGFGRFEVVSFDVQDGDK